jgi:hypothetical protein
LEISSADDLKVVTAGGIAQPFSRCVVDLQGQVSYDLAKLCDRLLPSADWRAAGQDTQSFSLRGPLTGQPDGSASKVLPRGLVSPELAGSAGLRWQSADLWGIPVGPGSVTARLSNGTLDTGTLEVPVSQGVLQMAPRLRFSPEGAVLSVDAGQVLTGIAITPEMCRDWLKYVAPLAADATRAEGKFTLQLDKATVPLQQPEAAHLQGAVAVDAGRLGPGPLALQFVSLGEQIRAIVQGRLPSPSVGSSVTWASIPPQRTRFQLVDGRVYHDQFELHVGDAVIRTRGSVGLDQTLALTAQVPIRDEWLGGDPRLAVLRGLIVEIPIGGTFQRPELDSRALEQLASQTLRQTANRLMEEGLQRGLQELLGPRR